MAGGFRQSYISRNQCLEHIAGETPLSFTFHLTCQLVSGVKHGQDHTKQLNFRVQTLFNLLIGMKKLYNTFKRKELTLERYQQSFAAHMVLRVIRPSEGGQSRIIYS